jgi:hypothetical protein
LAAVEVDVVPGQGEHLASAQAEDEEQDVCRIERVAVDGRRLEESCRLGGAPDPGLR